MSDQFLNFVKNCSKDSKSSISQFLSQLLDKDLIELSSQDSESSDYHFSKLQHIFNKVSHKFSIERSREISKDERSKKMLTNHQYNYGEITFRTIYKIIKKLRVLRKLGEREIFYDLGSGSGKVIFGAGLCYPFQKCKGIEFLESLYSESLKLRQKIMEERTAIQEVVNECTQQLQEYRLPTIQISNTDFKTVNQFLKQDDWSDATVVFVSSTCYSRQVMQEIGLLSQKLDQGTMLITLTKSLDNSEWKVVDKFQGETSWGACTIYLHRKETTNAKVQLIQGKY